MFIFQKTFPIFRNIFRERKFKPSDSRFGDSDIEVDGLGLSLPAVMT